MPVFSFFTLNVGYDYENKKTVFKWFLKKGFGLDFITKILCDLLYKYLFVDKVNG